MNVTTYYLVKVVQLSPTRFLGRSGLLFTVYHIYIPTGIFVIFREAASFCCLRNLGLRFHFFVSQSRLYFIHRMIKCFYNFPYLITSSGNFVNSTPSFGAQAEYASIGPAHCFSIFIGLSEKLIYNLQQKKLRKKASLYSLAYNGLRYFREKVYLQSMLINSNNINLFYLYLTEKQHVSMVEIILCSLVKNMAADTETIATRCFKKIAERFYDGLLVF